MPPYYSILVRQNRFSIPDWFRHLSYGKKTGFAVFSLAAALTGSGGAIYYFSIRATLLEQMGARLKDVGRTGAYLFTESERNAIERLNAEVDRRRATLSAADLESLSRDPEGTQETLQRRDAEELMAGADYQTLVQRLRRIKDGSRNAVLPLRSLPQRPEDLNDRPLVRYAYLLGRMHESPQLEHTYFLVDADYQEVDNNGNGTIEEDEQGDPIATAWHTPGEEFKRAFHGEASAMNDWYSDNWGTWLSAAVPIKAADGRVIAVLGLDYDIRGEANLLRYVRNVAIGLTAIGLLLSLLVSLALSRLLSRRVRLLGYGVERMRKRDFSVQLEDDSRDELGRLAQGFNDMVSDIRAYSQGLQALNSAFERFVPREFLRELGHESVLTLQPGDAVMKEMTVMFCDIRSFTAISEQMSPAENFHFLNDYLSRMGPIIRENGGFIDKYIGDALMALFPGGPEAALRAGSQMVIELSLLNVERRENNQPPLRFGIGVHHGSLMLGAIGEERRLDGTVISDAVNIAARLEQLTKRYHVQMLVSADVIDWISKKGGVPFASRFLGSTRLRGKSAWIKIHEVLEGLPAAERDAKLAGSAEFEAGLNALASGQYRQAMQTFEDLANRYPLDLAARAAADRLQRYMRRQRELVGD
ncbi:MAG: adenylate/guanylate cyclase domain-containing protein [Leptospirales bacterium]|nr:adenylate/guanylate cyclase domain-containing protein [Leptospirales bacterium]